MLKEAKPLKHAQHIDDAEVEANRVDAWARLYGTLDLYAKPPKPRKATKPTYALVQRRLEGKSIQSKIKASRQARD
jgi:ribosome-associated protein